MSTWISWLAKVAGGIAVRDSFAVLGIALTMWPLVLFQRIGTLVLWMGVVAAGPIQILLIGQAKYLASLSLFLLAVAIQVVANESQIGPDVCALGGRAGLFDC
jgi:hypothetical protein